MKCFWTSAKHLSKCHCKTSEIWPKISIKENFCKRTVRRKAVLLWEISCQAVFVCESCYGSTKSTKYRRFDGANYSTRLHFSVNSNVVPKLFTYSQNYERRRAGKRFFFSVNLRRFLLGWICSCYEIMMEIFFKTHSKWVIFEYLCKYWQLCSWHP